LPDRKSAYYKFEIPAELISTTDQVIDVSVRFEFEEGPGLAAELLSPTGNIIASGERMRLRAAQSEILVLHVFGLVGPGGEVGSGAFTPIINVLPQIVSIESQALLPGVGDAPGGPTASLVVTLQGDRLERATAQEPANYVVTFLGADDAFGGGDDQTIAVADAVYNAGANRDVSSGRTFPTAIRQTINLLFDQALPAGSYRVDLSSDIQTAAFNDQELGLLAGGAAFNGHPIVSFNLAGNVQEGASIEAFDLVLAQGAIGDFSEFLGGTRFLTQLHNDLSAVLDELLASLGDDPLITAAFADQVIRRFEPALGPVGGRLANMLIIVLDPVSIDLEDEDGDRIIYDPATDEVENDIGDSFIEVGGNIEVIVIANPLGAYDLEVSNVPALPRGTIVQVSNSATTVTPITNQLRSGQTSFTIM
jgi:hypothetical protein